MAENEIRQIRKLRAGNHGPKVRVRPRYPEAGHPDDVEMYSMETVRYRRKLRRFLRY